MTCAWCRYLGELRGSIGLFPANYTEQEQEQEEEEEEEEGRADKAQDELKPQEDRPPSQTARAAESLGEFTA